MAIAKKIEEFLINLKNTWKKLPPKEKVGIILDLTCSIGSGLMSTKMANMLTKDSGLIEKLCVRTTMTGLGVVAGDISSKAIRENFTQTMDVINEAKKEANANE